MNLNERSIAAIQVSALLGQRIRNARMRMGLSQEELAAAAGLHVNTIKKIENGKITRLDLETYCALARVLGLETDWPDWLSPKGDARFAAEFVLRTTELEFVTADASVVRHTRSSRIRAKESHLLGYTEHMSSDGEIESLKVSPGTLQGTRTEGGEMFLDILLPKPLEKGEETDISMQFDLRDSFSDPADEYWRVRVNYPTEVVKLMVHFHPERPCTSYRGYEIFASKEHLHGIQPRESPSAGPGRTLTWEIPSPTVGCVYKLCWQW